MMDADGHVNELVLSIDAGGTTTDVCIAKRGEDGLRRVVGRARGGPANVTSCGVNSLFLQLEKTIPAAAHEAGIADCRFDFAMVGLAGGADSELCAEVQRWLEDGLCRSARVVSDAAMILSIAEALAPAGYAPIGLIVGTGSVVFYRTGYGDAERTNRVGGWGPIIGDDGSGYWIGREAIRRVLCAVDQGCDEMRLVSEVFKVMRVASSRDLIAKISEASDATSHLAGLAETVLAAAKEGDETAEGILVDAADAVSEMLDTAVRSIIREGGTAAEIVVACAGGMVTSDSIFSDRVKTSMRDSGIEQAYFIDDPAAAAIQLAPGSD